LSIAFLIRMKALVSASPSDVARKSVTSAGDGAVSGRLGCTRSARRAFEEERHRDLQDVGDLLQPARADAARALLVFLDLVKRQAKCVAEFRLAQCQYHPAHAHPGADVLVDGFGVLIIVSGSRNLPTFLPGRTRGAASAAPFR
jgi:hypothetical protein